MNAMKRILKHVLWIIPSLLVVIAVGLATYTAQTKAKEDGYHAGLSKILQVQSKTFQDQTEMPVRVACRGAGISPHIQWSGAPSGTRSYALIATDWDAPAPQVRLFPVTHWVLYNIPNSVTEIPEGTSAAAIQRQNGTANTSVVGAPEFTPPCPPMGRHQYRFRVYALDVDQLRPAGDSRGAVFEAMSGHILAYGELIGLKSP